MEKEREEYDFLIPSNVNTKFEIFQGIGWLELGIIGGFALVGLLIFLITGLFSISPIVRFFIIILVTAFGFFFVRRDPISNQSPLNLFLSYMAYRESQKRYYYKRGG